MKEKVHPNYKEHDYPACGEICTPLTKPSIRVEICSNAIRFLPASKISRFCRTRG